MTDRSARSRRSLTATFLALGLACPAAAEGWQAGTARVAITPREPMWMAGYGVAEQALRGGRARPLGQGPRPRGPLGPQGRAGHARPLRDRPRPLDWRSATASRTRLRPGARAGGPGVLAHTLRAGRGHQPADHVPARRRAAAARSRTTPVPGPTVGRSSRAMGGLEPVEAGVGDRPGRLRGQPAEQQGERRPRAAREARAAARSTTMSRCSASAGPAASPRRGLRLRLPLHGARLSTSSAATTPASPRSTSTALPRRAGNAREWIGLGKAPAEAQ